MRGRVLRLLLATFILVTAGSPGLTQPDEPVRTAGLVQSEDEPKAPAPRHYEGGAPGAGSLKLFEDQAFSFFEGARARQVYRDLLNFSDLPMPITVCFRNGTGSQWQTIERVAQRWEVAGTRVKFEFRKLSGAFRYCNEDRSLIRISISGRSSWSAIGKQAFEERFAYASMNVAYDHILSSEREGVILHEFGHALGLEHEHLHSQSNCTGELDLDRILAILAADGNPRTRDQIEQDFATNFEGERVGEMEFDEDSVMLYALREAFFRDPKTATCIYPLRSELSDGDIGWVRAKYLPGRQDAIAYKLAGYAFVRARIESAGFEPSMRDDAVGFISAYYPFAEPSDSAVYAKNASSILSEFAADPK